MADGLFGLDPSAIAGLPLPVNTAPPPTDQPGLIQRAYDAWLQWRNANAQRTVNDPYAILGFAGGIDPVGAGRALPGIRAFHGSPYDFDAFDLSKIGTGEGAQAYGHGLYFAGNEDVARTYQAKVPAMRGTGTPMIDGKPINFDDPLQTAAFEAARHNGDRQAAADFHARTFAGGENNDTVKILRSNQELPNVKLPGHMYEVNIAADPSHLLDWDKPIHQQSPQVSAAIESAYPGLIERRTQPDLSPTIQSAFPYGIRPQVSDALNKAGIPGIQYLDQGSRAAGDGTRNYVIFDPRLITILRKYGMVPPVTATALGDALAGSDTQQQ